MPKGQRGTSKVAARMNNDDRMVFVRYIKQVIRRNGGAVDVGWIKFQLEDLMNEHGEEYGASRIEAYSIAVRREMLEVGELVGWRDRTRRGNPEVVAIRDEHWQATSKEIDQVFEAVTDELGRIGLHTHPQVLDGVRDAISQAITGAPWYRRISERSRPTREQLAWDAERDSLAAALIEDYERTAPGSTELLPEQELSGLAFAAHMVAARRLTDRKGPRP